VSQTGESLSAEEHLVSEPVPVKGSFFPTKAVDRAILSFLILLFFYSGLDKLFHYQGFVNALADYVLVPKGWAKHFAMPVIAGEVLIAIGLLIPVWRRTAAWTAAGTLLLFTLALGLNYFLGGRGICGCWFTVTLAQSTEIHVVQNLVFMGLAVVVAMEK
jgi:uncharacterized membrane protein YphA (DoxX/SURF4 family)